MNLAIMHISLQVLKLHSITLSLMHRNGESSTAEYYRASKDAPVMDVVSVIQMTEVMD